MHKLSPYKIFEIVYKVLENNEYGKDFDVAVKITTALTKEGQN